MLLLESLTERIIGAGVEVHDQVGPCLLECSYQAAMAIEMSDRGLRFVSQPLITVNYKGRNIGQLRPDFIVEEQVVLEIKCVERFDPVFHAQLLSYMRASGMRVGLLMNFHRPTLKEGLKRMVL
jgi:GxxExxY protein